MRLISGFVSHSGPEELRGIIRRSHLQFVHQILFLEDPANPWFMEYVLLAFGGVIGPYAEKGT